MRVPAWLSLSYITRTWVCARARARVRFLGADQIYRRLLPGWGGYLTDAGRIDMDRLRAVFKCLAGPEAVMFRQVP